MIRFDNESFMPHYQPTRAAGASIHLPERISDNSPLPLEDYSEPTEVHWLRQLWSPGARALPSISYNLFF